MTEPTEKIVQAQAIVQLAITLSIAVVCIGTVAALTTCQMADNKQDAELRLACIQAGMQWDGARGCVKELGETK